MAERYTNIRLILDKLMRHPLMQDLNLETAVDYAIDFMRIVGVPNMFETKTEVLHVKDYRAKLPCDYYNMVQIRNTKDNIAFRYSTDNFHYSNNKSDSLNTDYTYKVQGEVIFTSVKDCKIEIVYEAIATDREGYPLMPDNSSYTRALELYIKKQWFTILFDMGKINGQALNNVQQEYAWAVGDCQSEFNRLNLDKAESLFNSYKTMIVRSNEHRTGFKTNGTREVLKYN